jgi:uncharacterized damage-inducible protein DinB
MSTLTGIIKKMKQVFEGDPWYGKSVMKIIEETDESIVYKKANANAHSAIELLYHMINWEAFTLHQLEGSVEDPARYELMDWREIDPQTHKWSQGVAEYTAMHKRILEILEAANEDILEKEVKFRNYKMRFLLDGLIDHNIYHAGQLAALQKTLFT